MFFEFKHGGHALAKDADDKAAAMPSIRSVLVTPQQAGEDFDPDSMTPFRFLVEAEGKDLLPAGQKTVEALDKLGNAVVAQTPQRGQDDLNPDSKIPPIFTYWSQFIDHELTARTDRTTEVSDITLDAPDLAPVNRATVERDLLNRRTPALELDCLYGDGVPGKDGAKAPKSRERNMRLVGKLRDGAKMRIGVAEVVNQPPTNRGANPGDPPVPNPNAGQPNGPVPPPANDLNRDLPRIGALLDLGVVEADDFPEGLRTSPTFRQRAFIGDPRNDENLVVAQFHLGLLRFHNAVVDWLRYKEEGRENDAPDKLFEDARKIVRWTFQWLTVNQFLGTLLDGEVLKKVLAEKAKLYRERVGGDYGSSQPYMPVEFSVACYRFGHTMIRHIYDYNRNFGRKPEGGNGFVAANAPLDLLFLFTGKSPTPFAGVAQTLPHNWIIEWDRFDGRSKAPDAEQPTRLARKVDTQLAASLGTMVNEGEDADLDARVKELLKHLARRNLRRGYQLSLPTGQAMAKAVGAKPLTAAELGQGKGDDVDKALQAGEFFERTPLWFYVLKEAEVRGKGERLGELGSRIVAETFIGVLLNDPASYLSQAPDWNPSKPVPGAGGPVKLTDGQTTRSIETIADLLRFAGVSV